MNEERIKAIFSDETFVKQLLEQENPEQVQELLASKEIDVSVGEIVKIRDVLVKQMNGEINMDELSDEDLEDVSGGCGGLLLLAVIGIGAGVGAVAGGAGAAIAEHFTRGRW